MELTAAVVAVLSPVEMKTLRKTHAGMTLETLSKQTGVSVPQLSRFENGVNGLRLDQVKAIERVLLRAAAEKSQTIQTLFGKRGEDAAEMAEGSSDTDPATTPRCSTSTSVIR
jgi:transcriptional regulator with XRE-family HTH domain